MSNPTDHDALIERAARAGQEYLDWSQSGAGFDVREFCWTVFAAIGLTADSVIVPREALKQILGPRKIPESWEPRLDARPKTEG